MKKLNNILYIFYFLIISFQISEAQTLLRNDKTTGKIENNGTIRVRISGSIIGMPDTIGGRVEFIADAPTSTQIVPNVTYNQLLISGSTRKFVDSLGSISGQNPLRTRDSLIVENNARFKADTVEIHAQATITNKAQVYGKKEVKLNGEVNQNVDGNGSFTNVNLDNQNGATVVNGGGFKIQKKLELTRGELRNDKDNNFSMGDSSLIKRHVGASLQHEPIFDKSVSVQYVGDGHIAAGGEIPTDSSVLQTLLVQNTDGVTLTKNTTVNDSLYVGSNIYAEPANDTVPKYILTITSEKNPVFNAVYAEIVGSIRRTQLKIGDTLRFNNPYTYAFFATPDSLGDIAEITFRMKPDNYPIDAPTSITVKRVLDISGKTTTGNIAESIPNMRVGYGWRNNFPAEPTKDEAEGLDANQLVLKRYSLTGLDWVPEDGSQTPSSTPDGWSYSFAYDVTKFGRFSIGMMDVIYHLVFNARVLLEGAYRDGQMANDLRQKGLIPNTPPDIEPYNRDPKRSSIVVTDMPDSVLDWVVLEFKDSRTGNSKYVTCILNQNGSIVDPITDTSIVLNEKGVYAGVYQIGVLHRNHLPVYTEEYYKLSSTSTVSTMFDFSRPDLIMGRFNSLKPLALNGSGSILFGMKSGDVNQDGLIGTYKPGTTLFDMKDYNQAFDNRNKEGYFIWDTNLDGIVTTRDLNYILNNIGSQVSK